MHTKGTYSVTIILGRVGKDIELKKSGSGTSFVNTSVATNYKLRDEEKTEWHNIVLYGSAADFLAKYGNKGDLIRVTGENRTRSWEKDNVKHYMTEIISNDVQIIISTAKRDETKKEEVLTPSPNEDDLPF